MTESLAARWEYAVQSHHLPALDALLSATYPADREKTARRFVAESNVRLAYHTANKFHRYRRLPRWMDRDAMVAAACEALVRAAWQWSPDYRARGNPVRFSTYAHRAIWSAMERWREVELRRGLVAVPAAVAVIASDFVGEVGGEYDAPPPDCPLAAYGRKLTAVERRALTLLYGFDGNGSRVLREVGEHLGVSAERVRQIKDSAVAKMREAAAICPAN